MNLPELVQTAREGKQIALGADAVEASVIRRLIIEEIASSSTPIPDVTVADGTLTGDLDLSGAKLSVSVHLLRVRLDGNLFLEQMAGKRLKLTDCAISGRVAASGAVLENDLLFGHCSTGLVELRSARVGGSLRFEHCTVGAKEEDASIDACFAQALGDLSLAHSVLLHGPALLRHARVRGDLVLNSMSVSQHPEAVRALPAKALVAIDARGIDVGGAVYFERAVLEGLVSIREAKVGGIVCGDYSRIRNHCRHETAKGQPSYSFGFSAVNSTFGGSLLFREALCDGGEFRLFGTRVQGNLDLSFSIFINDPPERGQTKPRHGDCAICMTGLQVGGAAYLRGCKIKGETRLKEARITGTLLLRDSSLVIGQNAMDTRQAPATLYAEHAEIGGHFNLANTSILGRASLYQIRVDGNLDFGRCSVAASTGGNADARPEFDATLARVGGSVYLGGFKCEGTTTFAYATVQESIWADASEFIGPKRVSKGVSFSRATVRGVFYWRSVKTRGTVDFTHAEFGTLLMNKQSHEFSDGRLHLDGVEFEAVGTATPGDPLDWIGWIRSQAEYRSSPYQQVARARRQAGMLREAREAFIAMERDKPRSGLDWVTARLYDFTLEFGHNPWRLAATALVAIGGGALLFDYGYSNGAIVATRASDYGRTHYPLFDPLFFALDVFLPVGDLRQEAFWSASAYYGSLSGILWSAVRLEGLLGWLLTTMLLVYLTGLARKE